MASSYQIIYSNGAPLAGNETLANPLQSHSFLNKIDKVEYSLVAGSSVNPNNVSYKIKREDASKKIFLNSSLPYNSNTLQVATLPPARSCPGSRFQIHIFGYTYNSFLLMTSDSADGLYDLVYPLVHHPDDAANGADATTKLKRIVGVYSPGAGSAGSPTTQPKQMATFDAFSVGAYWIIRSTQVNAKPTTQTMNFYSLA